MSAATDPPEVQFRDLPEVKRPSGRGAWFGVGFGLAFFGATMVLWALSHVDRRSGFTAFVVLLWLVLHTLRTHRPAAWPRYLMLGVVAGGALLALIISAG